MAWKEPFAKGKASFQASQFTSALSHFNKAIDLQPDQFILYDSRAAVYERLSSLHEALLDSKKVIGLAPDRWQGYARSSRLFLKAYKYDAASKMAELALQRVKPDDAKRRVEFKALKEQAKKGCTSALDAYPYHLAKLPVEIFAEIFLIVVASDTAGVISLAQVCKQWRAVALSLPALWRTLILTTHHPLRKAKAWLERSKFTVRMLWFRPSVDDNLETIFQLLPGDSWSSIRILRIEYCNAFFEKPFAMKAFAANLEHLEVIGATRTNWNDHISQLHDDQLRSLTMANGQICWSTLSSHIARLTSLEIRDTYILGNFDLKILLEVNAVLERLVLDVHMGMSPLPGPEHSDHITHFSLSHLEIRAHNSNIYDIFRTVEFPSLRHVRLSGAGHVGEALDEIAKHGPLSVTVLQLQSCPVQASQVVGFMEAAPSLHKLEISNIALVANAVLEFLTSPLQPSPNFQATARCPLLTHLQLTQCPDLQTGPLVRLVRSRLSSDSPKSPAETPDHSPISSLVVDGCEHVEAESLPWFRKNVKHFSCIYMTKRAAKKWKR